MVKELDLPKSNNCAYRKFHLWAEAVAHKACKSNVRTHASPRNNREAREIRTAFGEQEEHFAVGTAWIGTAVLGIGIPEPTSKLRLPVARSGGEERQLAGWQLPRRVPAGARAAVPAGPFPATSASGIRDNTPGRTSRAGTVRPR